MQGHNLISIVNHSDALNRISWFAGNCLAIDSMFSVLARAENKQFK